MNIELPNRVSKGINVEDPMLFSANGHWYYFIAMISNPDISIGAQNLDNKHLILFEYTNELNSLCIYGNIVYEDIDGSISRFINRQDNHIEVGIRQMEKVSDGGGTGAQPGLEMFVPTGQADFMHTFLVQNIEILKRDKQNITYNIWIMSSAWYLLCSRIVYSNYGGYIVSLNSKNGYRMMMQFLTNAFYYNSNTFKVDNVSFEAAAATSKIEIPFISNSGDNCFSAIKYIFDRLYWNKGQMDESVKFISYSPVDNTYRCIDYNVDDSWRPAERPFLILSMFETDYEQQLYASNNAMASMIGKNATSTYEDRFKHKIWDFDPAVNGFVLSNSLDESDLAYIFNSRPETFKNINGLQTEDKYMPQLDPKWFLNKNYYYMELTDWNRKYSVYQSIVDNLMKRDAIVINMEGDITHQPGACIGIVLDRTIEKVPEMTPEQREELYKKHRQIESLFPILKITHRYSPSTLKGASSYTENAVLGRNFIMPPMQPPAAAASAIAKAASSGANFISKHFGKRAK